MLKMSYLAVVVAAVAAFVVGTVWYSPLLFGKAYMEVRGTNPGAMDDMRPPAGELLGEFAKNLVIAFVLTHFVVRWGRRLEGCGAAWTLGVSWVSSHASDGRRPS